jgi:glutamyl-tRNA synthetase
VALLGPSLELLADGVEQATPFFCRPELNDDARAQLDLDGAREGLAALQAALDQRPADTELDSAAAQQLLSDAVTTAGIKKGLLMKSLRAALLGSLQGPDLQQTWLLLHRLGEDRCRIARCL